MNGGEKIDFEGTEPNDEVIDSLGDLGEGEFNEAELEAELDELMKMNDDKLELLGKASQAMTDVLHGKDYEPLSKDINKLYIFTEEERNAQWGHDALIAIVGECKSYIRKCKRHSINVSDDIIEQKNFFEQKVQLLEKESKNESIDTESYFNMLKERYEEILEIGKSGPIEKQKIYEKIIAAFLEEISVFEDMD